MGYTEEDLKRALEKYEEKWSEEIDREYGNLPEHRFSRRFERRMNRLIRRTDRTPVQRRLISISKVAAAVFLFLLLGAAVTTVSVEAYREQFIRYVKKVAKKSSSYDFHIAPDKYYKADLTKTVYNYMPEGYEKVEEAYNSDLMYRAKYVKGSNNYTISLTVLGKDSASGSVIDTEDSELTVATIKGEDAIINCKDGFCTVVWGQRNVLCRISGVIDKEEAIRIAEGIEIDFLEETE